MIIYTFGIFKEGKSQEIIYSTKVPKRNPLIENFLEYVCAKVEKRVGRNGDSYIAWDYVERK